MTIIKLNVAWNANYYSTSLEAQITLLFIAAKKILFEFFHFLHKAPWLWSKPDYNKREITEIQ